MASIHELAKTKSGTKRWRVTFKVKRWGQKSYTFYSRKKAYEFASKWEREYALGGEKKVTYDRIKEKWGGVEPSE